MNAGSASRRGGIRPGRTLLGGYTLLACAFSLAPIVIVLAESVTPTDYIVFPPPGFSAKWYVEIWQRPEFLHSLTVSLVVATVAACLATTIGAAAALALARARFFGRDALQALFLSPLSLPGLVLGLALLQFYATQRIPRNLATLSLAHLVITIPYAIRLVLVALAGHDRSLEQAAQSLGAGPWRTFRLVTLPLIMPGIVASLVFAFIGLVRRRRDLAVSRHPGGDDLAGAAS